MWMANHSGIMKMMLLMVCMAAPLANAAGFLAPHGTMSLAEKALAKDKDMPQTKHTKAAGGGYKPGSPLYEKQEKRKAGGAQPAPKQAPAGTGQLPVPTVKQTGDGVKVVPGKEVDPVKVLNDPDTEIKTVNAMLFKGVGFTLLLTHWLPYVILIAICAFIWEKLGGHHVEGYAERPPLPDGFTYGLFSFDHCFGHHNQVCLCSWCCSAIRMADTYSKQPSPVIKGFWAALMVLMCMEGLITLTLGYAGICWLVMVIYLRQKLRAKYNLETGGATYVWDCLSWSCFPCCTVAQEARQVEFVGKTGFK